MLLGVGSEHYASVSMLCVSLSYIIYCIFDEYNGHKNSP